MNYISPNSPAYYLTSVTKDRLPVFRLDLMKTVVCRALDEARTSGGFLILAYVIMPDHFHIISDGEKKPRSGFAFRERASQPPDNRFPPARGPR